MVTPLVNLMPWNARDSRYRCPLWFFIHVTSSMMSFTNLIYDLSRVISCYFIDKWDITIKSYTDPIPSPYFPYDLRVVSIVLPLPEFSHVFPSIYEDSDPHLDRPGSWIPGALHCRQLGGLYRARCETHTGGLSEAGLHLRRHGFRWNMVKPGEKDVKTPTTGIY